MSYNVATNLVRQYAFVRQDIQSYEVINNGCFANVKLIIWLLILGKLNQSPSIQI